MVTNKICAYRTEYRTVRKHCTHSIHGRHCLPARDTSAQRMFSRHQQILRASSGASSGVLEHLPRNRVRRSDLLKWPIVSPPSSRSIIFSHLSSTGIFAVIINRGKRETTGKLVSVMYGKPGGVCTSARNNGERDLRTLGPWTGNLLSIVSTSRVWALFSCFFCLRVFCVIVILTGIDGNWVGLNFVMVVC